MEDINNEDVFKSLSYLHNQSLRLHFRIHQNWEQNIRNGGESIENYARNSDENDQNIDENDQNIGENDQNVDENDQNIDDNTFKNLDKNALNNNTRDNLASNQNFYERACFNRSYFGIFPSNRNLKFAFNVFEQCFSEIFDTNQKEIDKIKMVLERCGELKNYLKILEKNYETFTKKADDKLEIIKDVKEDIIKENTEIKNLEKLSAKLVEDLEVSQVTEEEIRKEVEEYEEEIWAPFHDISKRILEIDSDRVKKLISRSPVTAVQLVFECASIILGQHETTWKIVKQTVADSNFAANLQAVKINTLTDEQIVAINEKLQQIKISEDHMERISDIGSILFRFLNAGVYVWKRFHEDILPRKNKVNLLEEKTQDFKNKLQDCENKISGLKANLKSKSGSLKEEENYLTDIEKNKKEAKQDLQAIQEVTQKLEPHVVEWAKELNEHKAERTEAKGLALLKTAEICYSRSFSPVEREYFMHNFTKYLLDHNFLKSASDDSSNDLKIFNFCAVKNCFLKFIDSGLPKYFIVYDPHSIFKEAILEESRNGDIKEKLFHLNLNKIDLDWKNEFKELKDKVVEVTGLHSEIETFLNYIKTETGERGKSNILYLFLENGCQSSRCQVCNEGQFLNLTLSNKEIYGYLSVKLLENWSESTRKIFGNFKDKLNELEDNYGAMANQKESLFTELIANDKNFASKFFESLNKKLDTFSKSLSKNHSLKIEIQSAKSELKNTVKDTATYSLSLFEIITKYIAKISAIYSMNFREYIDILSKSITDNDKRIDFWVNAALISRAIRNCFANRIKLRIAKDHRIIVAIILAISELEVKYNPVNLVEKFLYSIDDSDLFWKNLGLNHQKSEDTYESQDSTAEKKTIINNSQKVPKNDFVLDDENLMQEEKLDEEKILKVFKKITTAKDVINNLDYLWHNFKYNEEKVNNLNVKNFCDVGTRNEKELKYLLETTRPLFGNTKVENLWCFVKNENVHITDEEGSKINYNTCDLENINLITLVEKIFLSRHFRQEIFLKYANALIEMSDLKFLVNLDPMNILNFHAELADTEMQALKVVMLYYPQSICPESFLKVVGSETKSSLQFKSLSLSELNRNAFIKEIRKNSVHNSTLMIKDLFLVPNGFETIQKCLLSFQGLKLNIICAVPNNQHFVPKFFNGINVHYVQIDEDLTELMIEKMIYKLINSKNFQITKTSKNNFEISDVETEEIDICRDILEVFCLVVLEFCKTMICSKNICHKIDIKYYDVVAALELAASYSPKYKDSKTVLENKIDAFCKILILTIFGQNCKNSYEIKMLENLIQNCANIVLSEKMKLEKSGDDVKIRELYFQIENYHYKSNEEFVKSLNMFGVDINYANQIKSKRICEFFNHMHIEEYLNVPLEFLKVSISQTLKLLTPVDVEINSEEQNVDPEAESWLREIKYWNCQVKDCTDKIIYLIQNCIEKNITPADVVILLYKILKDVFFTSDWSSGINILECSDNILQLNFENNKVICLESLKSELTIPLTSKSTDNLKTESTLEHVLKETLKSTIKNLNDEHEAKNLKLRNMLSRKTATDILSRFKTTFKLLHRRHKQLQYAVESKLHPPAVNLGLLNTLDDWLCGFIRYYCAKTHSNLQGALVFAKPVLEFNGSEAAERPSEGVYLTNCKILEGGVWTEENKVQQIGNQGSPLTLILSVSHSKPLCKVGEIWVPLLDSEQVITRVLLPIDENLNAYQSLLRVGFE